MSGGEESLRNNSLQQRLKVGFAFFERCIQTRSTTMALSTYLPGGGDSADNSMRAVAIRALLTL